MKKTENNLEKKIDSFIIKMDDGFNEVNRRLEGVDKRLEVVDKRVEGVDKRLEVVDKRLEGVDKRLEVVDKRLEGVDKRLDGVDKRFNGIDRHFIGMDEKIDNLAIATQKGFNEVYKIMNGRFDNVENRLDRIEFKTYSEHSRRLELLEDGFREIKSKLKIV